MSGHKKAPRHYRRGVFKYSFVQFFDDVRPDNLFQQG